MCAGSQASIDIEKFAAAQAFLLGDQRGFAMKHQLLALLRYMVAYGLVARSTAQSAIDTGTPDFHPPRLCQAFRILQIPKMRKA
jgi:hypothetical protein